MNDEYAMLQVWSSGYRAEKEPRHAVLVGSFLTPLVALSELCQVCRLSLHSKIGACRAGLQHRNPSREITQLPSTDRTTQSIIKRHE